MAGIKHATQTAKPDDPDYDVSADEWNEDHTIDDNSITISKILDFVNQAVLAVEAEPTLNLTGVIPDSAYPNAVLKDGTRAMTGNLDMDTHDILLNALRLRALWGTDLALLNEAGDAYRSVRLMNIYCQGGIYLESDGSGIRSYPTDGGYGIFESFNTVAGWRELVRYGTASDEFNIKRGGDIIMLDQKMMTLGTYTDAQRPAAGTAGRIIFNTDDGFPNYDDGTNWRDINGNIT